MRVFLAKRDDAGPDLGRVNIELRHGFWILSHAPPQGKQFQTPGVDPKGIESYNILDGQQKVGPVDIGDAYIYVGTVVGLQNCRNFRKKLNPDAKEPADRWMSKSRIHRFFGVYTGAVDLDQETLSGPLIPPAPLWVDEHDSN